MGGGGGGGGMIARAHILRKHFFRRVGLIFPLLSGK